MSELCWLVCEAGSLSCACDEKAAAEMNIAVRKVLSLLNFIVLIQLFFPARGEIMMYD